MMPDVSLVWLVEFALLDRNLKEWIEAIMPDSLERRVVHKAPLRNIFTSAGWKGIGNYG